MGYFHWLSFLKFKSNAWIISTPSFSAVRKVRESQNGERKKSVNASFNPQSMFVFHYITSFLLSNMVSNMQQLLIKILHFPLFKWYLLFCGCDILDD